MPTSRKGKGTKQIGRRPVPIPPSLAMKLHELTNSRPPLAPLLIKPNPFLRKNRVAPSLALAYRRWNKSDHSRLFTRAIEAAGLDPGKITMYA